jgi:hypothetical protein
VKIKTIQRSFYRIVLAAVVLVALLVPAGSAPAQAVIKVNDNVSLKFGILMQAWADWQQIPGANGTLAGYSQNLFLRRMRILFGGTIAKNVSFFVETDSANLGKTPKTASYGNLVIQDAFGSWKIADEFNIQGGLILIPLCRNCNTSAASLLTIDYESLSFLESAPTQSNVGRDTGFQAMGYLLAGRLEYRAGVYQGMRNDQSKNAFRFSGRLMYDFFDKEHGQFYPGTYLNKKKVLAIGASYDTQSSYAAYDFDGFFNWPIGKNGVTAEIDYINYNGGTTFPTLKKQNDVEVQAGFYFDALKLMPFGNYESQSFVDDVDKIANTEKFQAGFALYPFGYNFNIKFAYRYSHRPNNPSIHATNDYTIQFQFFYF